jgi:uncharacterized damage-inducible protein DinB
MDDRVLREHLIELLSGGHAHVTHEAALEGLPPGLRHVRPKDGGHTIWELLEHMRIAQEDILRYTLDASWKSPAWPKGYWPSPGKTPSDAAWESSVARFRADLEAVCALVRERDLTAPIPHAAGHTYLREVLLVADHNAYHLGQIVETRRALGAWG